MENSVRFWFSLAFVFAAVGLSPRAGAGYEMKRFYHPLNQAHIYHLVEDGKPACPADILTSPQRVFGYNLQHHVLNVSYFDPQRVTVSSAEVWNGESRFTTELRATGVSELRPVEPAFAPPRKMRVLVNLGNKIAAVSTTSGSIKWTLDEPYYAAGVSGATGNFTRIAVAPDEKSFFVGINPLPHAEIKFAPVVVQYQFNGDDVPTIARGPSWMSINQNFAGAHVTAPAIDPENGLLYVGVWGPDRAPSVVAISLQTFQAVWEAVMGSPDEIEKVRGLEMYPPQVNRGVMVYARIPSPTQFSMYHMRFTVDGALEMIVPPLLQFPLYPPPSEDIEMSMIGQAVPKPKN